MANSTNPYQAYQQANETKSHAEQIIMLYVAAICYMQQAKEADKNKDYDTYSSMVNKTISIMRGLQACLDFSANEEVANALNNYYEALDVLLASALCEDDKQPVCDQIIENLRIIQKSWENISLNGENSNVAEDEAPDDDMPLMPPEDHEPQDVRV